MHHINQLPLINLESASVCSLKDKELEGKFLLLSFTVCDCCSISTNFKTTALLLFFRNLLCLKKGWFHTLLERWARAVGGGGGRPCLRAPN